MATTGELTQAQAEYFRTLERMEISDSFRRKIANLKDVMRRENTRTK